MYKPTAKSYFSGAGGMDLGLAYAGIEIIQSLELWNKAATVNALNLNHAMKVMDIKDITVKDQQESDIIVGTYPCTKYSSIADIHGYRTGDDLFLHFFRHIAIEQPEMYIVENVPGMRKFPVVMEAMTKLPDYYVNVLCPVDSINWVPQSRPRLILFGTRRPFKVEYPDLTSRPQIKDILEPEPNIKEIPAYVHARLKGEYRDLPILIDPDNPTSYARTCLANYGKDKSHQLVKDPRYPEGWRYFTVREYARLQGFPDWFSFEGANDGDAYRMIGNAVAVPVARWAGIQAMKYFNKH